jgi:uncharacterized protein YheU (UPF0270 family)
MKTMPIFTASMGKYTETISSLVERLRALRAEVTEVESVVARLRALDGEAAPPPPPSAPLQAGTSPIKVRLPGPSDPIVGGVKHLRLLFRELAQAKAIVPKSAIIERCMAEGKKSGAERESIEVRVTNALQTLRMGDAVMNYKVDGTNVSAVWGPVEAFDGDKPKPEWTIMDRL